MHRKNIANRIHYRGGINKAYLTLPARENRKTPTPAEKKLWTLLRNRQFGGLKFRRQHQIGPFIVDFYCSELRLVLELDGEIHDSPEQKEHDKERDAYLKCAGFRILRIRNIIVIEEPGKVFSLIAVFLSSFT